MHVLSIKKWELNHQNMKTCTQRGMRWNRCPSSLVLNIPKLLQFGTWLTQFRGSRRAIFHGPFPRSKSVPAFRGLAHCKLKRFWCHQTHGTVPAMLHTKLIWVWNISVETMHRFSPSFSDQKSDGCPCLESRSCSNVVGSISYQWSSLAFSWNQEFLEEIQHFKTPSPVMSLWS